MAADTVDSRSRASEHTRKVERVSILSGAVRLRECVNTEFVWEKQKFVKAAVSRPSYTRIKLTGINNERLQSTYSGRTEC